MQTLHISLPDHLKDFVDGQVDSGRFSDATEYIRGLIRDDERRRGQHQLQAMLVEGLHNGPSSEMARSDWDSIRQAAFNQFEARRSRKYA